MNQQRIWILTFILLLTIQLLEESIAQPGVGHRFLASYGQECHGKQNTSTIPSSSCQHPNRDEKKYTQKTQNQDQPKMTTETDATTTVSNGDFFGIFQKLGTSWHTILQMFRSIVNSAGGTTMRSDVYVKDLDQGKQWLLQQNIWEEILQPHLTLYHDFDKTFEDVLDSFLRWAASDEAPDTRCRLEGGANGKESEINVSKALRRLEKYAAWMAKMEKYLGDLKAASIRDTFSIFDMKMSIDDCQRLVWWLDLGAIDWNRFDNAEPREIARVFVWVSHYMLLHPNAQDQGLVLVNSLNQVGFGKFMTMLPVDLGMELDEFVISVIPIKTKFVVLMERPPWAKFAYQMLKPFMKSNMRRRVNVIEEGLYPTDYIFQVVGVNAIPKGIENYPGKDGVDFLEPYFDSKRTRRWF